MTGINTRFFFDRQAVISRLDRMERRVLSKFGAFVRRRARSSVRRPRRKTLAEMSPEERASFELAKRISKYEGRPAPKKPLASSRPGEPFRDVTGEARKNILFGYDPDRHSVVTGIRKTKSGGAVEALEYGGTSRITGGRDKGKLVYIEPRPVVNPARDEELPGLPAMFRDQL